MLKDDLKEIKSIDALVMYLINETIQLQTDLSWETSNTEEDCKGKRQLLIKKYEELILEDTSSFESQVCSALDK